jgi:DNA-binding transcriptional ArsR family regulator
MTTAAVRGFATGQSGRIRKATAQVNAERSAVLLKQLTDPTRLQALQILADGERHVGALCDAMGLPQAAVSHHLSLLRHGGLVVCRRQGKNTFYSLTTSGRTLADVVDTIMRSSALLR